MRDRGYRDDHRYDGRSEDDFEDVIKTLVYVGFGIVGILMIAGFLDAQFGWGLQDWIIGKFNELVGGEG